MLNPKDGVEESIHSLKHIVSPARLKDFSGDIFAGSDSYGIQIACLPWSTLTEAEIVIVARVADVFS